MIGDNEESTTERTAPQPVYQEMAFNDREVDWLVTSLFGGRRFEEYRE